MLALKIIAVILGLVGLVGCILPVIPGPPLSWLGLLLVWFTHPEGLTSGLLITWLVITVVVTILDYVAPSWITTKTGGSKAAGRGAFVGLILGLLFFPPWGMIAGSFIGALVAEVIVGGSAVADSVKPAFGSFLGFLLSTGLKLTASAVMLFYIFKFL
ncbi:MAG: DUF456 domain-containing protein [Bacteroidales bacterium]|nr:DUF456 domain-containing protein [Bacteroidales bacterium]